MCTKITSCSRCLYYFGDFCFVLIFLEGSFLLSGPPKPHAPPPHHPLGGQITKYLLLISPHLTLYFDAWKIPKN